MQPRVLPCSSSGLVALGVLAHPQGDAFHEISITIVVMQIDVKVCLIYKADATGMEVNEGYTVKRISWRYTVDRIK